MPSTNLEKRGNMAVADVDVPGIKDNFMAHSKINDVLDKGSDAADFFTSNQRMKGFLHHM